MKGIIFNIQKFSVHDGPGIRTVVFFKGCPLRCRWCSNPESQLVKVQILHNASNCTQCHQCETVCPTHSITFKEGQFHMNYASCIGCETCLHTCPNKALTKEGEMKTVEEVMQTVLQDKVFYEESNGGLTLSGGEILAQPDFAIALLKEAHRHHLHTCCETTGYATKEVFCSVAEHVDFIYMDMKHWDEKKHREGTGVSNVPILENMKLAVEMHKEILPRIPVIPGYNDSLEDAVQFSKTLKKTGILKCQLLPFHQFGENKYSLLGKDYAYRDIPAYHPEDLETYRQTFTDNGIEAFF